MKLFRRKISTNLAEIHQYVQDLKGITALRDKCIADGRHDEAAEYDETIKVMQLVMLELNKVT